MIRSREETEKICQSSKCKNCIHAIWTHEGKNLGIRPDGSIRVLCTRLNWIIDDSNPKNKDIFSNCFAILADELMRSAKLSGCWGCPFGLSSNQNFTIEDLDYTESLVIWLSFDVTDTAQIICKAVNGRKYVYDGFCHDCPGHPLGWNE